MHKFKPSAYKKRKSKRVKLLDKRYHESLWGMRTWQCQSSCFVSFVASCKDFQQQKVGKLLDHEACQTVSVLDFIQVDYYLSWEPGIPNSCNQRKL